MGGVICRWYDAGADLDSARMRRPSSDRQTACAAEVSDERHPTAPDGPKLQRNRRVLGNVETPD
jgi:hypothetical protein